VSDDGPADKEDLPQDLSVPMWVWTLLGFALVTAILIIVIIQGGAKQEAAPGSDDAAEETPADMQQSETQPVATEPA
jgi:hypothetical protein